MEIIQAQNIGVKFKLYRERRTSVRSALARMMSSGRQQVQEFWALKSVSFSVQRGQVLGVIGRNGSGKSTLLRVIGEIYAPDEGCLTVHGTVSTLLSIGAGFQAELSGLENIYLNGILLGFKEREIDQALDDIISFSELDEFIDAPVKTYSSGMNARLGFAIAVHLQRDIMLIDEVLGVGDAKFRQKCEEKLQELMTEDKTIILVSHNMESIRRFADQVLWMDKGTVRAQGTAQEVIEQYLKS